ncbi:MAG: hypothetical protein ACT4OI_09100 [Methanobacteriota archaeon]
MTTTPRTEREWHRKMAADLFNETWTLIDKRRRTPAEVDAMIHAAHASRYHWSKVGTPTNLAIGEWQLSHVYAILGRAEPSLYHARRCLELCRRHGLGDFVLAFAHEASARANVAAGRVGDARRHLALGRRAGEDIAEEDDRERFFGDLKGIERLLAAKRSARKRSRGSR